MRANVGRRRPTVSVSSVIEPPLAIRHPVKPRRGISRPVAVGVVAGSFVVGGVLGVVTSDREGGHADAVTTDGEHGNDEPDDGVGAIPGGTGPDDGIDGGHVSGTRPEPVREIDVPMVVGVPDAVVPEAVVVDGQLTPQVRLRALLEGVSSLQVDGTPLEIVDDAISFTGPANGTSVEVTATLADGSSFARSLPIVDRAPAPSYPRTTAVHITARAWADPTLRERVLDLARSGAINAVQLDVKDESGEIGYQSSVELARLAGATRSHYDPVAALAELHALGVRVIGRVVCFLDPVLAAWAWSNGRPDLVVQAPDGSAPLANRYGSAAFTNLADPDVRQYLIDISVEAAELGFDDILYDYVRRPEGKLDSMRFPGLERSTTVEVARFVRDSRLALAPHGVDFGVSVFGISATRPNEIAQDMRLMAPYVDYVAPMVYPSHWGPGEYGVADPNSQPGDIVERSLADFHRVVAGSDTAVVPWLQAFDSKGVTYGPALIKAQVDAADRVGSSGWLLWNAGSRYDPAAVTGLG